MKHRPHSTGGHQYGPVLSPCEEDFHPSPEAGIEGEGTIHNTPGYPAPSKDKTDPVFYDEAGEFDKVPSKR